MADKWVYAQLVQAAKSKGGPKEFIRTIKAKSYQDGKLVEKAKQNPKIFAGFGIGVLATIGVTKLISYFKGKFDKKGSSEEEAVDAEKSHIQQIKHAEQGKKIE